jgi:hypothetical protein
VDVLGPAVDHPGAVVQPLVAELGGQHHLVAPVGDGTADQPLVGERPVDVGGVQEVAAEVQGAVDGGDRLALVGRAVGLAHPHAAQAERRDGQLLASEHTLLHTAPLQSVKRPG